MEILKILKDYVSIQMYRQMKTLWHYGILQHSSTCIIKTYRQKAWDDGVAPSVYPKYDVL